MKRNTVTGSLFFSRPNSGAEWVMRMHSGITPDEEREMREWLLRSERNNTDLLRAETVWRLSGALLADREIQAELAQLRSPITPLARQPLWRAFSRRRLALAASIVLGAGILGIYYLPLAGTQTYITAPGEQHTVTLPDGSLLAINTDTSVRVAFTKHERSVTLESGEVFFQVEHDQDRPFVVQAKKGFVRAVGTRFNVLVYGEAVTVSVLEGRVEIVTADDRAATHIPYESGEYAAYEDGRLIDADPEAGSVERILAWREGKLVFDNWPIARAIYEHNRYAHKPIRLDVPELGGERITIVMRIGDTNALVGALSEAMPVRAVDTGDEFVLVRAPAPGITRQ